MPAVINPPDRVITACATADADREWRQSRRIRSRRQSTGWVTFRGEDNTAGLLQVAKKIGDHAPVGAVFRNAVFREILQPNSLGEIRLLPESSGSAVWRRRTHAFSRCIYILARRRNGSSGSLRAMAASG
jgi:hypothetical protein